MLTAGLTVAILSRIFRYVFVSVPWTCIDRSSIPTTPALFIDFISRPMIIDLYAPGGPAPNWSKFLNASSSTRVIWSKSLDHTNSCINSVLIFTTWQIPMLVLGTFLTWDDTVVLMESMCRSAKPPRGLLPLKSYTLQAIRYCQKGMGVWEVF